MGCLNHGKVLITGGLGFIGTTVSEHFLDGGAEVEIVDSMVSSVIQPEYLISRYDSVHISINTIVEYFNDDRDIFDHDLLIHAASPVGPASILQYQGTLGQEIVSSTSHIIENCIRHDLPLVYFSSAEVYGKSGMLEEESSVRVPPYYNARIEYALAKLTSEAMVLNSQAQGLKSIVIRPFNVAGPMQSRAGGFVMPTFVQQALGGCPVTVFGSGMQKRAFLGADDLARFLLCHLDEEVLRKPRIVNLGNPGNETTIDNLARRVINLLGSSSTVVHVDPKSIYGPHYYEAESFEKLPRIETAKEMGWNPVQSLDEIIETTADFYKQNSDTRGADARAS